MSVPRERVAVDKIDRLLAQKRRAEAIEQVARNLNEARALVLVSLETLGDEGIEQDCIGPTCTWLRTALPDLDSATRVLRRLHGNCNRAIANIARSKP